MISELQQDLRKTRHYHMANSLEEVLQHSKDNDLSYLDFLRRLLDCELDNRRKNRIKRAYRNAKLPGEKLIETFDFNFQTSITKRQVNGWLDFDWLDNRHNKVFIGPSGVGKTHLAIALSREALLKGYKVRFFTMKDFIEQMIVSEASDGCKEWLKELLKNDLIILDELGYLPVDRNYIHLFFQFINECYEYRSILITSNKNPGQWGNFFGDEAIAMAILDRLLHNCEPILLKGDSYRLKDKLNILGNSEAKAFVGVSPLRSKTPTKASR